MAVRARLLSRALAVTTCAATVVTIGVPQAVADPRVDDGVVTNLTVVRRQAGCDPRIFVDPALERAAQWHAADLLTHRTLTGDIGSDGSTPLQRAHAAGYPGRVAETVAVHPALAISDLELIRLWHADAGRLAVMRDCAFTSIGVRSAHSLDRTVVVAVYGAPQPE
ncbi:CAP domain-containing protein [[Mycobacterium] manitobense]|uniref:CAP domain-containing protein n=1 Tax=[Mycobacterium] manitobense TaxID=190147 RepID=UPI0021F3922E|nr:CAP domain-containing protein [[Mycobacterium] manitobense]